MEHETGLRTVVVDVCIAGCVSFLLCYIYTLQGRTDNRSVLIISFFLYYHSKFKLREISLFGHCIQILHAHISCIAGGQSLVE